MLHSDQPHLPSMIWVLPRFYGHLIKSNNGPGGCHDTATEIFSGVQAGSGGDAGGARRQRELSTETRSVPAMVGKKRKALMHGSATAGDVRESWPSHDCLL